MKKIINWSQKPKTLAEIYQNGLEMALMTKEDENGITTQASHFVLCKDFFQDAIQGYLLNEKKGCFGFFYDPKTDPAICMETTRIAVGNALNKNFANKIPAVLDFLNKFEKKIHLKRTKVWECEPCPEKYKSGVFLFEGSSKWMISPPMISLYTLLIRVGFVHDLEKSYDKTIQDLTTKKIKLLGEGRTSGCYDPDYLKNAEEGIERILKEGYNKIFYKDMKKNYSKKIPMSTMHDNCGIVGFSKKTPKSVIPYWFKNKSKKSAISN